MDKQSTLKAFSAGFLIMLLEVAGARLLYPYFGSSMAIWSVIIATLMLAMAAGYYFGGRISARKDANAIASYLLAIGGVFAALLPILVPYAADTGFIWQIRLAICSLLISLPVFALSTVSPLLIGQQGKKSEGTSAGKFFAISTIGSVFGTIIPAFLLLPYIGVYATVACAGIASIALALSFRGGKTAAFLLPAFVLLAYFVGNPHGIPTYFYTAEISEGIGTRSLVLDTRMESALNLTNFSEPVWDYPKYMRGRMAQMPHIKRAAMIGAGGCTQAHHIRGLFPNADISIVDIDGKLFGICSEYFYVNESANVHFITDDGRRFLAQNGNFDAIIVDAFSSGCSIPPHMGSAEFFLSAGHALAPGGIMMANIVVEKGSHAEDVFCNTAKAAFERVGCTNFATNKGEAGNMVITASSPRAQILRDGTEIITDDKNPVETEYSLACT